ncbi:MAG: D-2-hydroxyacid dehydrogenase [Vibrio sp.]|uniref:D-2-hydroxyacid dehydrogenase n=1 Tax=Vibrio sp. TaxID=678 RepID=UPI003A843002
MKKIISLDSYALNPDDNPFCDIASLEEITCYDFAAKSIEETIDRIGDAEIVILNKTIINREVIDACPNLKFISVAATGYNVIDSSYAAEKGIKISNVPIYGTTTVSEHTFALIFALARRVELNSNDVIQNSGWTKNQDWTYWLSPQIELAGKTLGIIGFGNIGKSVGRIGAAMGMKIIAFDAVKEHEVGYPVEIKTLDAVFSESDILSLHCPALPSTMNMINAENLNKMKENAFLINCSRGQLVVEQDLADALNNARIAGAALDVLQIEPPQEDNPLLSAKNCIITPHLAWATLDARQRIAKTVIDNIKAFKAGQPINVVN